MNQGASEHTETTTVTVERRSGWWIFFGILGILAVAFVVITPILIYTGAYSIGADAPDARPMQWVMGMTSDAGVAAGARSVIVPINLEDSSRVLRGAGMYAEMCENCHLAPGKEKTEISQGLYPPAPIFFDTGDVLPSAKVFWVIQHGIGSTGMPAWGKTHSPELIWAMVAFLQRMPGMTSAQYDTMLHRAPPHDEDMQMPEH